MAHTTAATVRAVLPGLLMRDDDLGIIESGTNLTLHDPAVEVPTILKITISTMTESTLTEGTDYDFVRSMTIKLGSAATGERYIAQCYHGPTSTQLDNIISFADRVIDDFFYNYDTPPAAILSDWSARLAASFYLIQYATATEENIVRGKEMEKIVKDSMAEYRKNTLFKTETGVHTDHQLVMRVN